MLVLLSRRKVSIVNTQYNTFRPTSAPIARYLGVPLLIGSFPLTTTTSSSSSSQLGQPHQQQPMGARLGKFECASKRRHFLSLSSRRLASYRRLYQLSIRLHYRHRKSARRVSLLYGISGKSITMRFRWVEFATTEIFDRLLLAVMDVTCHKSIT